MLKTSIYNKNSLNKKMRIYLFKLAAIVFVAVFVYVGSQLWFQF